jgi:hypothetical protein
VLNDYRGNSSYQVTYDSSYEVRYHFHQQPVIQTEFVRAEYAYILLSLRLNFHFRRKVNDYIEKVIKGGFKR